MDLLRQEQVKAIEDKTRMDKVSGYKKRFRSEAQQQAREEAQGESTDRRWTGKDVSNQKRGPERDSSGS